MTDYWHREFRKRETVILASDWLAAHDAALTAERDALREQVARVEALADEWIAGGTRWGGSNVDARAGCGYRIRAVLHPTDENSKPTKEDNDEEDNSRRP